MRREPRGLPGPVVSRISCARRTSGSSSSSGRTRSLRRAAAYLSQANLPGKMMYPLVRELAVDGIPVAVTCRVLKIARQPYYRWLASPVTDAELTAAYRANALFRRPPRRPRFLLDEAGLPGSRWPSARPGGSAPRSTRSSHSPLVRFPEQTANHESMRGVREEISRFASSRS